MCTRMNHNRTLPMTPGISSHRLLKLVSLAHWKGEITQVLELHLQFNHCSPKKWPRAHCAALAELIVLVTPQEANKLLSEKVAASNEVAGVRTSMVRQVIAEVRANKAKVSSITGSQNSTSTCQPHGENSYSDP